VSSYPNRALADEDMLSLSVGFACPSSGQQLDRRSMTRRITTAYLDHLSFVESPAYEGAQLLSVCMTPRLDNVLGDEIFRWAQGKTESSMRTLP
jgi:hypothetical protein